MEVTPGKSTTEFITSLIPIVLGVFFMIWGAVKGDSNVVNQGMTLLLGGAGIYGVSRGLTKLGAGIGGGQDEAPVAAAKTVSKA